MNEPNKILDKLIYGILVICLTIIGFFLSAVYTKVISIDVRVQHVQIELAKLQTETQHYVTREQMIEFHNSHLK